MIADCSGRHRLELLSSRPYPNGTQKHQPGGKYITDSKPKVLVTGASGLLGGLTVKHLKDKYDFSALNRSKTADMDDSIPWTQADIADFDAMAPAFEGIDMVVHMANYTGDSDS